MKRILIFLSLLALTSSVFARDFHISKKGNDANNGLKTSPFLTIQKAADIAVEGDTITVHEGIYRERVDPKEGGTSNFSRIVYQAAEGEKVVIKGSEIVNTWKPYKGDTWTATVSNELFHGYNPYATLLVGDGFKQTGIQHHIGEVFLNGKALFEQNSLAEVENPVECKWAVDRASSLYAWHSEVKDGKTIFWANFRGINPNKELVEITARKACFYPSQTGRNYITVRGFEMTQSANMWCPGSAEQEAVLGTNWSRGWVIENNRISNSKCSGISLGKDRATGQNEALKQPKKPLAVTFNEVIFSVIHAGWSKAKIGSHVVRNNVVFDCGEAGIVAAFGGIYSQICNNLIYRIYTRRNFTGGAMAGIKLMGAIGTLVKDNIIYDTYCGIWLDWAVQDCRFTQNVLYNNDQYDFHNEVDHGPLMMDHNLFLSKEGVSTMSRSQGAAFVHDLMLGRTKNISIMGRWTPYFFPHSTIVRGVSPIYGGDNRYCNNLFIGEKGEPDVSHNRQIKNNLDINSGLSSLNKMPYKTLAEGNIFYNGAEPYKDEKNSLVVKNFVPTVELTEIEQGVIVKTTLDDSFEKVNTRVINTKMLGETIISLSNFEDVDGAPYNFNTDFYGNKRNEIHPLPGPFENLKPGVNTFTFIHP